MTLQRLYSLVRKAIDDYEMIDSGDKVAIGISGGKDSLTLLYALNGIRQFYPKPFELQAFTVDLGFHNLDLSKISELCSQLKIEYTIIPTEIAHIVFDERGEKNPCSLCAKMRKGALNHALQEAGCNKIAYAHHMDDVVETMMMSLIYEGRLHTFSPVTYLNKTQITVIRPLMYVEEAEVKGFVNKYKLPVVKSPCPADGYTKRQYIKELIQSVNQETPGVKQRMFTAIKNGNLEGWKNTCGSIKTRKLS